MPMAYCERFMTAWNTVICTTRQKVVSFQESMQECLKILIAAKEDEHTAYFIGNGGSAGIAIHMTADFLKNGGIRTVSLFNPATITCLGNDLGYEYIFSEQLKRLAKPNDILLAVSSSGNSPNILRAVQVAQSMGCHILTFSGFGSDNRLRSLGECNFYVPCSEYGIVESIHQMILQELVDLMKEQE